MMSADSPSPVAREQFAYSETAPLLKTLDTAAHRSGVSRGQAFEDFLQMTVCALSGGQMEEQYMSVVKKHTDGAKGNRGCDSLAELLGAIVDAMEKTRQDVLGDLFQGAITYGEAGQFYTPESITQLMAEMTVSDGEKEGVSERRTVCDPCCGSGRMLLAIADKHPHWEFVGQDIDLRCVRMTAINLGLRNLYGHVVWGDSLGVEQKLIYRTGFNFRGVIRELPFDDRPPAVQQSLEQIPESAATVDHTTTSEPFPNPATGKQNQLRFF